MAQPASWDLYQPVLADAPSEWGAVAPEVLEALRPTRGYYTLRQDAMLKRIAAGRFFLLQNRGPKGQAWRCGRCKGIHDYFTLHCIERPYNGVTHAIGHLEQRIGRDFVLDAVELGAIQPISQARALKAYSDLRALGYSPEHIFGGPSVTSAPQPYRFTVPR